MKKVNFGAIGLGAVFEICHLPALKKVEAANLTMVCDINKERAEKFGRQYGLKWTSDYKEFLKDDKIEAVLISVPHNLHYEIALEAAKRGKHILCEKPFAVTLNKCDEIIKVFRETNCKLMVAENFLFEPAIQIIKEAVTKKMLGELQEIHLLHASPVETERWRWKKSAGGGVLLDPGVHLAALARYFMGGVKSVLARTKEGMQREMEVEDSAIAILEFGSGNIGSIEVSWRTAMVSMHYELRGTSGSATFNAYPGIASAQLKIFSERLKLTGGSGFYSPLIPAQHSSPESYVNQLSHFLDCVVNDKEPSYNGEQGRKAVEIIMAGYKSAAEGQTIILPLEG